MEIVSIAQAYTDYLFQHDNRVSYNVDKNYVRPYLGVLLQVKNLRYFAPLTSSGKGKKLAVAPKPESITFYPIDNCRLGGINLNNMIPLVDGVYKKYTEIVELNAKQQLFHEKQIRFLRKHRKHIRQKALKIYTLKISGRLYPNYDKVTCDFKKLEKAAAAYNKVMPKAKVYFTDALTPDAVVKVYQAVGKILTGKVAVKVHSGEKGNQNYLRPAFMQPIIEHVHGTVVECNTAYDGARNTTAKHQRLIKEHGWDALFPFDLMDAGAPDLVLPIKHGRVIKQDYVGKNLANYDSLLVLSHFKGHPMGGFGGALKQLSIGIASTAGKAYIHTAGKTTDQYQLWDNLPAQDLFLESMADAASAVVDYFHGNAVYINVLCNLSVDCDCCAKAEDPCLPDIGILASTDPVALDQACLDLVAASTAPGREHFMERVNSRHGVHTVEAAADLGVGTREYDLIKL